MGEGFYLTNTNFLPAVFISAIVIVYYMFCVKYKKCISMMIGALCMLLILAGFYNIKKYNIYDIQKLVKDKEKVIVYGKIYKVTEKKSKKYCYVNSENIKFDGYVSSGRAVIIIDGEEKIYPGNYIKSTGTFKKFQNKRNEGGFDEKNYYFSNGIKLVMYAIKYETYRYETTSEECAFRFKQIIKDKMKQLGTEKYVNIYSGILLGDRQEIDEETISVYKYAGISHILSISGLHISLVGAFLLGIFRKTGKRLMALVLTFMGLLFYLEIIMNGLSARRAFIMFVLAMIAGYIGRTYDIISALAISIVIIITDNPYAILNDGFLLSVFAIFGIAVVYNTIRKFLKIKNKILLMLIACISVNVTTLPIVINMGNEVQTLSFIINIFILSTMSVMLILGITGIITGFVWILPAKILFQSGCIMLEVYEKICVKTINIFNAVKIIPTIDRFHLIIYYGAVIFFTLMIYLAGRTVINTENCIRKINRTIFILLVYFFCFISVTSEKKPNLIIKVIDVGQGDSIYINSRGVVSVIDAGSSSEKEISKYTILPFLKANGVSKIDYLYMTHTDSDHTNGMYELLNYRHNGDSYVKNLVVYKNIKEDEKYKKIAEAARKNKVNILKISAGDEIRINSITLKCLWPDLNHDDMDVNNLSVVMKLESDSFSMIFTGDIEKEAEEILVSKYHYLLKSDALKIAHHGSKSSSIPEFLNMVKPYNSFISVYKKNRYGHPGKTTLDNLRKINSYIYRTDQTGEIVIDVDKGKIYTIQNMIETFLR